MSEELNCPNCGHNLYDHKTACNHRDESGHWDCECRMSDDNVEDAIEINALIAERDLLRQQLEVAKDLLARLEIATNLQKSIYDMPLHAFNAVHTEVVKAQSEIAKLGEKK